MEIYSETDRLILRRFTGADADLLFELHNDPDVTARVLETTVELLGERAACVSTAPLMGAEDFAYVLQRVPGAMAWLGACPPGLEPGTAPGNHSNLVVFDEEPLPAGVALYAAMAMNALRD